MTNAARSRRERLVERWPAALIVLAIASLSVYAFRDALEARPDRLPGVDSSISYVWEVYSRAMFAIGRWPHWNPYFWGGTLHYADTLTAAIYPPALLLRWLEPASFLRWMAVLHMVIGGAGTLLLARVIGLGWMPAAAAAAALTIGGAAGASLNNGHMVIIYCTAWMPWTLALAILSVRRDRLLPHPGLPIVLVVQLLAGYLQGTIYLTAAVCLYYVFAAIWPEPGAAAGARWRAIAQLFVLGTLTLGLSAFQAFPLIQLALETARTQGLSYARASAGAWSYNELATFFWPFGNGLSHRIAYVGWVLGCAAPFAFLDRGRRRIAVFLLVLALATLTLAFGDRLPLFRLHYWLFPGLRLPTRILFITTLAVAALGAIGLERVATLARDRRWRVLAAGTAMAVVVVGLASVGAANIAKTDTTVPIHLWPWPPILAVAGLALLAGFSRRFGMLAFIPALAILSLDLTAFAARAPYTVPIDSPATLTRWLGPADGGRVWSLCPNRVGSNELMLAQRPTLDGPIGVTLRDFQDWLVVAGAAEWESDSLGPLRVRRDLLNAANVSTVVACEAIEAPGLAPVSAVEGVHVYRNEQAWPRAVWMCGAEELPRAEVERRLRRARYDDRRRLLPQDRVNVRWVPGLTDEQRRDRERRYRLQEGYQHEGTTWRYYLLDDSAANARALLRDEAVEDTHGVDRHTGELVAEGPAEATGRRAVPELLVGETACELRAEVTTATVDQPDGQVVADVDAPADGGVVLFSEPYYLERQAFVDGGRVPLRKANLAFSAVPVPAGRHRVELRLVPRTFYAGLATTAVTLSAWLGLAWYGRTRRRSMTAASVERI